jgi:DNA invertase Pin-like site-specific DNA recombinase
VLRYCDEAISQAGIKARTDVGVKRARAAGVRFGRPPKLTRHQQEQALKLLDQGEPQSAVAQL